MKRVGFESGYEKIFIIESAQIRFILATFPEKNDYKVHYSHWSYFENWTYRNYLVAKACGLQEADETNFGTFTISHKMINIYMSYTYLMYLKFGFGRSNQDACIEIRRGAMKRQQP